MRTFDSEIIYWLGSDRSRTGPCARARLEGAFWSSQCERSETLLMNSTSLRKFPCEASSMITEDAIPWN